jgi:hypothetical protein
VPPPDRSLQRLEDRGSIERLCTIENVDRRRARRIPFTCATYFLHCRLLRRRDEMRVDPACGKVIVTACLAALAAVAGCDTDTGETVAVPASAQTRQGTGVARWTLRPLTGDTITVDGDDESGTRVSEIEIRSDEAAMTVRVDATVVPVTAGQHPLPPHVRGLLTGAADDLAGTSPGNRCRAALVATIAASAGCGAGSDGSGCLTAPFQFCAAARACGAPTCDR